ncbi:putative ORF1 [Rodent Torque teno virus 6]|uniref:putative ORF1 n=1 Tax=Rodent Torque teno virus 6 TaxID=2054613 RepID=UPI000CA32FD7|nr:putative ORF1 [Rodent Torque teno virus 6]ATX61873.1 putative ORF1 [Rodent Torque teno virus 6]
MAFFWRRNFYRRPYTTRRSKYTNWRYRWRRPRRTYRRRYRVRRLRKSRRHVIVKQWNPINKKKCVIRGYAPLLYALGGGAGVQDFLFPRNKLILTWLGGGVHSAVMSLLDLFWEERYWRARWSSSNQGYNLFRYFGATITLWPMPRYSYIFWYSTEELAEDKEPLTVCHPSQLLLAKHHVIVAHYKDGKKPKPIKLHVKPPAKMLGVWMTFADYAKRPLLKWRVSLIDLENPWTGFPGSTTSGVEINVWTRLRSKPSEARSANVWYFPLLDEGKDVQVCSKKLVWNTDENGPKPDQTPFWPTSAEFETLLVPFYMYAFGRAATYYDMKQETHEPAPSDGHYGYFLFVKVNNSPAWRGEDGGFPQFQDNTFFITYANVRFIAAQGPWIEKSIPSNGVNATMTYKFFFQWGGTPGTQLPPTVPNAGGPPQPLLSTVRWGNSLRADIRDPTTISDEVLQTSDLDENGLLTNRALARITKSPLRTGSGKTGTLGCLRGAQISERKRQQLSSEESEEEETPNYSETEEEEAPRRIQRPLNKRQRMEHLIRRILQLNTGGTEIHGSTHLSGREKSHSI